MEYSTTVSFDRRESVVLEQAQRNAGAVFPPGSLELTLLVPLQRCNPLDHRWLVDIHWALTSLVSGLKEQSRPGFWRGIGDGLLSQQAYADVGRVAVIDGAKFPESIAGIRGVQLREAERAQALVKQALDGFPSEGGSDVDTG